MKELLSGLIGPVTGIIDKVVADKDQAAKLAHDIATVADKHAQELLIASLLLKKIFVKKVFKCFDVPLRKNFHAFFVQAHRITSSLYQYFCKPRSAE